MTTLQRRTRIAGWSYLALVCVAPIRLILIPNRLFVADDPVATSMRIAAHEFLFRVGLAADVLTGLLFLVVTLTLYRLFDDVDHDLTRLMVILGGLLSVPIYFLNVLNDVAVLHLVSGVDSGVGFAPMQRDALVSLFLDLHRHGVLINEIFWGLWLLPFGRLLIKSQAFPRVLGWLLYLNGGAYVLLSLTGLLWPSLEARVSRVLGPATLGEVIVMLWFALRGARSPMLRDG